jgi:4a-hydroxytetrahydrobiopterin dehydratase
MAKLSTEKIAEKLEALPGWKYKDNAISKTFKFKEFLHGIEFVQKVAEIAEAADHHPDITINYTRVTFLCSTHDAGGVTDKDFKLANNIEIGFKDLTKQQSGVWQLGFVDGDYPSGKLDKEIKARPFPGSCTPLIRV